jgi:hypothetical protein
MTDYTLQLSKMNYGRLTAEYITVVESIQNTALYGDLKELPELREKYTNVLYFMAQFEDKWDDVETA